MVVSLDVNTFNCGIFTSYSSFTTIIQLEGCLGNRMWSHHSKSFSGTFHFRVYEKKRHFFQSSKELDYYVHSLIQMMMMFVCPSPALPNESDSLLKKDCFYISEPIHLDVQLNGSLCFERAVEAWFMGSLKLNEL